MKESPGVKQLRAEIYRLQAELDALRQKPEWSLEWPTKPGKYWAYGYRSSYASKPGLHLITVRRINGDQILYLAGSLAVRKIDGACLVWTLTNLPDESTAKTLLEGVGQ